MVHQSPKICTFSKSWVSFKKEYQSMIMPTHHANSKEESGGSSCIISCGIPIFLNGLRKYVDGPKSILRNIPSPAVYLVETGCTYV
jgi:hypothetical protein